ncbi:MAG: enolase C-terminal domain-like protein, partial [Cyanobacteria bacterium J06636_27]
QMWGLDRSVIKPISVTIGISSPQDAKKRVRNWLEFMDVKMLKVKLGSPGGIEADKKMLDAVREEAPYPDLYVDANGGWSLEDAQQMSLILADMGVNYIEQPLKQGREKQLVELKKSSPIPIFVDESCFTSADIPYLAECADGVNIKLMKSGGLTEAMRMINNS